MADQSKPAPSPRAALAQIITAYRLSQLVYVAAELQIADLLQDGPRHYQDLAQVTGTHPNSLFRLLRALASAGIFTQLAGEQFELNALAENLRRDVPASLSWLARLTGQQLYPAWGDLLQSIKTGENAFERLNGASQWEFNQKNPAMGQVFDEAMSTMVSSIASAVVQVYDFARFRRIVDVGGGHGVLLATILKVYPAAQGVLFDQELVVQGGGEVLRAAGVLSRCELVGGSFFESVPGGGDVYLLSHIIHDWDDAKAAEILTNCRHAMQENQMLLVLERVIEVEGPTVEQVLADMTMLVMLGGRERTRAEYQTLLHATGFELTSVTPTPSISHIIEAKAI